ncbi:ABC transporter ATP-binding protein [Vulcanococcus limneticus]|uniref:ABC transporter ATP-binding protein n=1 Tax=Vulcanococcus limneticus TaxID=2170428 RepID=UPI00398C0E03
MSSEPVAASTATHDPVLRVEELSKCYRIYDHPRDRLLQAFWGERRQLYRDFWALHPLSFELARGQTLGVVGRNGSGKSTLLQLLCGTLTPSGGRVSNQGRIGALLELGSGFSPEFTGLENVHLNAALLGLSRAEIEARLDAILAFADIGSFIDQPVKTYSSGMVVRLAFAVQAHIDPDLLVVDEALAVGDELFQKKCYAHLERLKERGTSVLLVTHSCPQIIQHCDRALLLHRGRARLMGEPARITVTYQRLINASDAEWDACLSPDQPGGKGNWLPPEAEPSHANQAPSPEQVQPADAGQAWQDPSLQPLSTEIYPSHGARIEDLRIELPNGDAANVIPFGEDFVLCFHYLAETELRDVTLSCHIASHTGVRISGQSYPYPSGSLKELAADSRFNVRFHFSGGLWPGLYFVGGGITTSDAGGRRFLHRVVDYRALRITETHPIAVIGACQLLREPPTLTTLEAAGPQA